MININNLVRENVRNLTPYSCARDEFKGKAGIFMDANENPFGTLNRYPDPYQTELKKAISEVKGAGVENIFLGNGSDEVIDLCYRIFCNPGTDKALTFTPTYGMYEVSASVNDIKLVKVALNDNFQIDMAKTKPLLNDSKLKLIFICSPNNPTGNCFNNSDIKEIIKTFKGIVVIDEAYADFSDKASFLSSLEKYPNLIIMQTFSKAFGLAAIRVGMAFAGPEIIKYFNRIKPPYNISTINQRSALRKLGKPDELSAQVKKIKLEKARVAAEFKKLALIEKIFPSDSNFLLVKVKDAGLIYNRLTELGIITRNRNSVAPNCLRITIGTRSENNKLLKALKTING